MEKKFLSIAIVMLLAIGLAGCGSNRDSDGDTTGQGTTIADAAAVGLDNCAVCHDGPVAEEWLASRHANNLTVDEKLALNAWNDFDVDDDDPRPDTDSDRCTPCHNPLGDGQFVDSLVDGGPERMVVGCESCHGGGQFHSGVGPIPWSVPGPEQCGECHGLSEILFHSTSIFRNIIDTHNDLETTPAIVEGYNVKTGEQTGCVDCHYSFHELDLTVNNQWAESGHAGHLKTIKETVLADQLAALPADPTRDQERAVVTAVREAGTDAEAFIHDSGTNGWDNTSEDGNCQRCHTATGGMNWLNDPATYDPANNDFSYLAGWSAESGSPETEMIYCWVCHSDSNAAIRDPGQIPFPSGAVKSLGDSSNVCMGCHQGRESGVTVAEAIAADPEGTFSFINRHYFPAAALFFGAEVKANFEYPGREYQGIIDWPLEHVATDKDTCVGCHLRIDELAGDNLADPDHNFLPELADCSGCHSGITDFEQIGSGIAGTDFDGDLVTEGFQAEIDSMQAALLDAIMLYAEDTLSAPIVYDPTAYPYFFNDLNGNGVVDEGENVGFGPNGNRYTSFDAELLRAAYNYHANQDPCGDIHNARYVIQTIYDSIDALDDGLLNDSPGTNLGFTRPPITSPPVIPEGGDPVAGQLFYLQGTAPNECSDCHGVNAEGGSAPALQGFILTPENFPRTGRPDPDPNDPAMPNFPEAQVSEQEVINMGAWLQTL